MITVISIENFKGVSEPIEIELRPITLLFGANSAGKSIIADALNYFEACLTARSPASPVLGGIQRDFGNTELQFHRLVHNHDLGREIRIEVKCSYDETADDGYFSLNSAASFSGHKNGKRASLNFDHSLHSVSLAFVIRMAYRQLDGGLINSAEFASLEFKVNDEFLAKLTPTPVKQQSMQKIRWLVNLDNSTIPSDIEQEGEIEFTTYHHDVVPNRRDPPLVVGFTKAELEGDELPNSVVFDYLNSLLLGTTLVIENRLKNRRTVSGIRVVPDASFSARSSLDRSRWHDGSAAWDFLAHCGEDALIDINNSLGKSGIGSGYQLKQQRLVDFELVQRLLEAQANGLDIQRLLFGILANGVRRIGFIKGDNSLDSELPLLWPTDVGTGLSQVIPVIVAARCYPECLNFIAQPELHLHPALQCELADIFIDSINRPDANSFVLETHSEHLILRMLRRIRETERNRAAPQLKLLTHDLGIYHFRQDDGGTKITELEVDVEGDFIQPWPDNFFELDFYERFKTGDDE
jgi:hypothetical protein